MNSKNKRDGGVGDVWQGLMGEEFGERLNQIVRDSLEKGELYKSYDKNHILVDKSQAFDIHVLVQGNDEDETLDFSSIFPVFKDELEPFDFKVDAIDEWSNDAEAVFEGEIFGNRLFGFYCTNYLGYKDKKLMGQTIKILPSIVSYKANILPEEQRSFKVDDGPLKGENIMITKSRFVIPKPEVDFEICEFMFPILQIDKFTFDNNDVFKIRGSIPDEEENDVLFNVYINASNIEGKDELKVGEPFSGLGWLQAEIVSFDDS